jgi:hypothetical protein
MIEMIDWNEPFQLAAMGLSVDVNNAFFYCFQFA